MYEVSEHLFHYQHLENNISIDFNQKYEIKSFLDKQKRSSFYQLINIQRILVSNSSMEPSFFWFKNSFSSSRYNLIVQQQINIFTMLHYIDIAVSSFLLIHTNN